MLAARIAFSDPRREAERAALMDAHRAHLRGGALRIVRSGPFASASGGLSGALIVAEVEDVEELRRFSEADPFVKGGVYAQTHIVVWTVTIDRRDA